MKVILWIVEQACLVAMITSMTVAGTAAAKVSWAQAIPFIVGAAVALVAGGIAHVLREGESCRQDANQKPQITES